MKTGGIIMPDQSARKTPDIPLPVIVVVLVVAFVLGGSFYIFISQHP
jgi:hypothetical protein